MDIVGPWKDSGHSDNTTEGGFKIENVKSYNYFSDCIDIHVGDDTYLYNVSDFYRIKIMRSE